MAAVNGVRFRVKSGREQDFLEAHRKAKAKFPGLRQAVIVRTGERAYCFIGEWDDSQSIVNSRPGMIAILDSFRHTLEDLGGGLGLTDPVSGEVVLTLGS